VAADPLALVVQLVGLGLMIWIYRRDPDAGERTWRYR
jgi:hypothetical protein